MDRIEAMKVSIATPDESSLAVLGHRPIAEIGAGGGRWNRPVGHSDGDGVGLAGHGRRDHPRYDRQAEVRPRSDYRRYHRPICVLSQLVSTLPSVAEWRCL